MRGPRLRFVAALALVAVVAGAIGVALSDWVKPRVQRVGRLVASDPHDHAADAHQTPEGYWTCGMHPWVILPEPGLCPICHMELTPLEPAKLAGEIAIDPVVVQNIGVRVAPVTIGPLTREVRTVGTVTYDQSRIGVVNTKIAGWVEELFVDSEGAAVSVGQPLFSIYSPELYAAQEEYLLAYRGRQAIDADASPQAAADAQRLLDAARTRLAYFDVSDDDIRRLEATGEPRKTLTIASPHAGVVIEKLVNQGMRIEPGTPTYRIADLSRVWVDATLYEHQLPFVAVGQPATMTLAYLPGRGFDGEVAFVYPYLNETARQARVRLEFANPGGVLKPGMFAEVRLQRTLGDEAILVPREAVITTGERAVAFVSLGEGRFEPRDVELGVETGGATVQVLSGLAPGEMVVTSGQFLLDSESKMRSALAKMVRGEPASEGVGLVGGGAKPQAAGDGAAAGETCPVSGLPLGVMGEPVTLVHNGVTIEFCCAACPPKFTKDPARYLAPPAQGHSAHGEGGMP